MKERPILFSAPMVRAILGGTKTQTRRVVKKQVAQDDRFIGGFKLIGPGGVETAVGGPLSSFQSPYGVPGDRLWVRETFANIAMYRDAPLFKKHQSDFAYRASGDIIGCHKWTPSIHMPRAASRITLEVTGVRVERLQDISESDAKAEGTPGGHGAIPGYGYNAMAHEHYRWLWDHINGAGAWDANPWVWVIEFKRAEGGAA